ncbi:uncharacterized protein MONOS_6151 [Monocercomonoides exilis]|uniref:uncharacterized protein n=1 Tax=Monocercomonoides exilis TaxID=2049356 RepID=UPI00355A6D1F|nr:hypothetical protein MONOS_6151 [Monocercomonoides exilis]|eukprot:MONOS_6151.1-p1 / transcript=MONOS_6151.1 / gene=MONOS_6151 / organism=Monocercomonoides_exilis_PA203 / gene_product=unspecified product / transcript_product=unspecified product / location=Mono_scaffold00190:13041-13619(+) / protein_length=193 / sequence_SO=supercontig / SO=protein_coding / is_pseudo=false
MKDKTHSSSVDIIPRCLVGNESSIRNSSSSSPSSPISSSSPSSSSSSSLSFLHFLHLLLFPPQQLRLHQFCCLRLCPARCQAPHLSHSLSQPKPQLLSKLTSSVCFSASSFCKNDLLRTAHRTRGSLSAGRVSGAGGEPLQSTREYSHCWCRMYGAQGNAKIQCAKASEDEGMSNSSVKGRRCEVAEALCED